jgi:arylsulfatase A-like enzyme
VHKFVSLLAFISGFICASSAFAAGKAEHVIVMVWDGMRPDFIRPEYTPTLYQLARGGVMFENHHAVYCSATEVNGTAIATGAYPENSGIIANRNYVPEIEARRPVDTQAQDVIRRGDELSGGHYLLRSTVAEILQAAGKKTVIAGVKQVALMHDRRERPDTAASVNLFDGKTLPASTLTQITNLLGSFPPSVPGQSTNANEPRDRWTTQALLGPLWTNGVAAYSLLWLSEPDSAQHAAGPGSPKALAALASSDRRLAEILAELDRRSLRDKTDIMIVSDHGFSTIQTSVDVNRLLREAGFPAFRDFRAAPPNPGDILVNGQGGSVLFYVIGHDTNTIHKLVHFLQQQDFAGVLLTREPMEGTFTLSQAKIQAPHYPDVVMSMRWSPDKSGTGAPGMFASDGGRRGAGNHASLSRFCMRNTLVAAGPDFKKGFNNTTATGNTDLAPTILWLLGVKPPVPMDGRVLSEALGVEAPPVSGQTTRRLEARRDHETFTWRQYLQISQVNDTIYLDEGNAAREMK